MEFTRGDSRAASSVAVQINKAPSGPQPQLLNRGEWCWDDFDSWRHWRIIIFVDKNSLQEQIINPITFNWFTSCLGGHNWVSKNFLCSLLACVWSLSSSWHIQQCNWVKCVKKHSFTNSFYITANHKSCKGQLYPQQICGDVFQIDQYHHVFRKKLSLSLIGSSKVSPSPAG